MAIRFESKTVRSEAIFELVDTFVRARSGEASDARPLGDVKFRVLGPKGSDPFNRQPELAVEQNESGFYLYFGRVRLPDEEDRRPGAIDSGLRRNWLPSGTYTVQVESDVYQPQTFDLIVPGPDVTTSIEVPLHPNPTYPFRNTSPLGARISVGSCTATAQRESHGPALIRGVLHAVDGSPIEGAEARLKPNPNPGFGDFAVLTGPTGEWLLVLPPLQKTTPTAITIKRPGLPAFDVNGLCIVNGRESVLRETVLRGWVLQNGTGVPGATVAVGGQPDQVTTRPDGGWFYYFRLDDQVSNSAVPVQVVVTATLPTGESQSTPANVKPDATALVPTFRFP